MTVQQYFDHLTHTFMDMLNQAEQLFGQRDLSWTFIGIEFKDDAPYIMYYPDNRISICLSPSVINFQPQAYYQLSHEVCHFLWPTGKNNANLLEEGVSTFFSYHYENNWDPKLNYALPNIEKSKYVEPFNLFKELFKQDQEIIKKLRVIQPHISLLTKEDFASAGIAVSEELVDKLLEKFNK